MIALSDADVAGLGDGGVVVRDGFLPDALVIACAAEVERCAARGALRRAAMGADRVADPSLRGDWTAWVEELEAPCFDGVRERFEVLRRTLNEAAWLGLSSFTLQIARYPGEGARYARHRDALRGDPARRATAIAYLNPAWHPDDGGALRVHLAGGPLDVAPIGGRLVLFLADRVEHEVLACQAPRRAATAWFRGP